MTPARTPLETVEIGIQTYIGMAEMTELLSIKEKSQNPDAVFRVYLQALSQQMTKGKEIYRPTIEVHAR